MTVFRQNRNILLLAESKSPQISSTFLTFSPESVKARNSVERHQSYSILVNLGNGSKKFALVSLNKQKSLCGEKFI